MLNLNEHKNVLIAIPSYKRATKQMTNKWLKRAGYSKVYDIKTFVYIQDPEYHIYDLNGYDFVPIPPSAIPKPNLSKKRQFIVDYAKSHGYEYVLMIDDDLFYCDSAYTIQNFIEKSIAFMDEHKNVALSCPAHTEFRLVTKGEYEYPVIASHSAFIKLDRVGEAKYSQSELVCEDMAFSLSLLEQGMYSVRINSCVMHTGDAGVDGFTQDGGGLEYKYKAINLDPDKKAEYDREQTLKEFGYLIEKGLIYLDPEDEKIRLTQEAIDKA